MVQNEGEVKIVDDLLTKIVDIIEQFSGPTDIENKYPDELLSALISAKLFKVNVSKKWGGLELDWISILYVIREISRRIPALGLSLCTHIQAIEYLKRFKPEIMEEIFSHEDSPIFSLAITESVAGTDLKKISTKIREIDGILTLEGSKSMVTNGIYCDYFLVLAKDHNRDFSVVIVRKSKNIEVVAPVDVLGMRGAGIARVSFKEVELREGSILHKGKMALKNLLSMLSLGRLMTAAIAMGIIETALQEIFNWATVREVLNRNLIEYDNVKLTIGEIISYSDMLRNYITATARKLQANKDISFNAAVIKFASSEIAKKAVDFAFRLFASHGYSRGTIIEKLYRDVKALEFMEGSNEALLNYVFHTINKKFKNNERLLCLFGEDSG